jgi:glyoxylase I family protein
MNGSHAFVQGIHGVRYQVKDVARSVSFYTTHLGLTVEHQQLPAFASIKFGDAQILLSGPQASEIQADAEWSAAGTWRMEPFVFRVKDLEAFIETLRKAGVRFRNEMEIGPGGKQIQIEDPDGNPIELFEPAR